jgi:hypothetical protein
VLQQECLQFVAVTFGGDETDYAVQRVFVFGHGCIPIRKSNKERSSFLKKRSKKLLSGYRGLNGKKFFGPFFQKRTA